MWDYSISTGTVLSYWSILRSPGISSKNPIPPPVASTFATLVSRLPKWEAELLSHVEFAEDPHMVTEALSHGLRAASDGSSWPLDIGRQGSYGWIMTTDDPNERAVRGMGVVRGADPDSYRAEAYGMLTQIRFLIRLAEFTQHPEAWSGILATDSKSLLDTLFRTPVVTDKPKDSSQLRSIHELDPLCAEWDLLSGIIDGMASLPAIQLQHIKGHQDRKTRYERLPLLAQLNVDADDLANTYQRTSGHRSPEVLLTDTAGVHVVTPSGCITSNYVNKLRYQATHGPLLKCIQERYRWNDRITNFVNWQAHGVSLRKHMKRKSHYIKFVHGILPTNRKLHRNDPVRRRCPACHSVTEDWKHIVRCPHITRVAWRTSMIEFMEESCQSINTRPLLWKVLRDGIQGWCSHTSDVPFCLDYHEYSADARRLIWQQNRIGWEQIFLGRFSKEWGALQDAYYAREEKDEANKRRTGQRWQATVIGLLWDRWYKLWTLRNQDLHGANEKQKAEAARRAAYRDLRDIYDVREQLEPQLQDLLMENVETHMNHPLWHVQNWLAINVQLFRDGARRWREQTRVGTPSIRQFFGPIERR
jgi:hypothetical protein